MKTKHVYTISFWATILVGIWIVLGAFDANLLFYGDFYMYLMGVIGIIGIIGALLSLGIIPVIGGLAISGELIYLGVSYGFSLPLLFTFLRAVLFVLGGSGMILTYEAPTDPYSIELVRLELGKQEYYNLKNLGINNLKDLVEEKGNEEVCSITSIPLSKLKEWIGKSEQILKDIEELKKGELSKDYKNRFKK